MTTEKELIKKLLINQLYITTVTNNVDNDIFAPINPKNLLFELDTSIQAEFEVLKKDYVDKLLSFVEKSSDVIFEDLVTLRQVSLNSGDAVVPKPF